MQAFPTSLKLVALLALLAEATAAALVLWRPRPSTSVGRSLRFRLRA